MTDRRTFIAAAGAWLLPAVPAAQERWRVHRVGYLSIRAGPALLDDVFVRALGDLGYVVGRNLLIEYRFAGNDTQRLQNLAQELAQLKVDVIFASSAPVIGAAMQVTRTIPIVMGISVDPVATGLVASLARPGGNVTGMSILSTDLARKRLQLLHEVVPSAKRVALLALGPPAGAQLAVQPSSTPLLVTETQAAGRQLGIDLVVGLIATPEDLPSAFARFESERAHALVVQGSPLTSEHRAKIVALAARHRLPDMYEFRAFVDEGGLVSYGPDPAEMYRRAASFVDRILRGARPGELAVEQASKFELVFNAKRAKTLGLAIPQSLDARADEVIR